VIAVDANLLVYAKIEEMEEHEAALAWLQARLSDVYGVGLPWTSLLAFVRVVSNPRVFERPLTVRAAWAQVAEWLDRPNTFVPEPTERHPEILGSLLREATTPALVPDAHLAALAIEYGLTLQTSDRDFARFPGLKWENPLAT
jgi:hypothetical protein